MNPTNLNGATTISTGTTGANISFGQADSVSQINGASNLTLQAGTNGSVLLYNAVGNIIPVASFMASGNVISVQNVAASNATQTYNSNPYTQVYVGQGSNSSLILQGSNYTTQGGNFAVFAAATNLANTNNLISIDTTTQNNLTGGNISFSNSINGADSLILNAGNSSAVTLQASVGSLTNLASLAVNAHVMSLVNVSTSGTQTYTGLATQSNSASTSLNLFGNYLTQGSNFSVNNAPTLLMGTTSIDVTHNSSNGAVINFDNNSTIDGAFGLNLQAGLGLNSNANTAGVISLNAAVGSLTPLMSLVASAHTISLRNVATSGLQQYTGLATTGVNSNVASNQLNLNGSSYVTQGNNFIVTSLPTVLNAATISIDTTNSNSTPAGANIVFGSSSDSSSTLNAFSSLSLNAGTQGTTSLYGAVGTNSVLNSLTTYGNLNLNGGAVATLNAQTYHSAVVLGATTQLTSTLVTVNFADTTSTLDGNQDLTINAPSATFGGVVGGLTNLKSLTVNGRTAINGGAITTTKNQAYNGAVLLGGANAAVNLVAGNTLSANATSTITFGSTIDNAKDLSLMSTGGVTLDGQVGSVSPLNSLSLAAVTGSSPVDTLAVYRANANASITTINNQNYQDAVFLNNDIVAVSTAGAINFKGINGPQALVVNGATGVNFNGEVGYSAVLNSLDVTGSTTLNTDVVHTAFSQTYHSAVAVLNNATLTSDSSSLNFISSLDGNVAAVGTYYNLNLNAANSITFGGAVGAQAALNSLNVLTALTTINGGSVTTIYNQNYNSNSGIVLGTDTTLSALGILNTTAPQGYSADINTSNSISSPYSVPTMQNPQALPLYSLTINNQGIGSPLVANLGTAGSNVGLLTIKTLTKGGVGTLTLNNPNTIAGINILEGMLVANTAVTSLGSGTINITPLANNTATLNLIGSNVPTYVANLINFNSTPSNSAAILTEIGVTTLSGNITISGNNNQFITNNTVVNGTNILGSLTLADTISDGASVGKFIKLGTGTIILTNGSNTYTGGTDVDNGILQVNVGVHTDPLNPNATLAGSIGTGNVTINNGGTLLLNGVTLANTLTSLNGSGFAGTQGALVGMNNGANASAWTGNITLGSDSIIGTTGASDTFTLSGTMNGAYHLSLGAIAGTQGTIVLANTVGAQTPLAGLTANVSNLTINTNTINTSGANNGLQTYNSAVTLLSDANLSATDTSGIQGKVLFNNTVNGAYNLAVTSSNGSTLNGAISVGTLTLSGGAIDNINANVTTSGALVNGNSQEYNDAVVLNNAGTVSPAAFTLSSIGGAINFASTLTGVTSTLSVKDTASSNASVTVAGLINLGGLTMLSGNYAVNLLDGGTIHSAVAFINTAGVQLNSAITQMLTIDGALTSTASTTTVQGTLNTTNAALNLGTVSLAGNTTLNAGTTLSLGAVSSSLTSSAYPNLTLTSTLGSTLNGSITDVHNLSLSAASTATDVINAAAITTTGTQLYNNATQVEQLASLSGSIVLFASTVNNVSGSQGGLAITTTGGSEFDNTVNLGSLSLSGSTGVVDFVKGGSIVTANDQTYNDSLSLGANTTLQSTAGNVIIGNVTVDGSNSGQDFSLTINNAGTNSSIAGTLQNLSAFTKAGLGSLTLSGADNAIGPITISAGTLIAETTSLGASTILSATTAGAGYQVGDVVSLFDATTNTATGVTAVVTAIVNGIPTLGLLASGASVSSTDLINIVDQTHTTTTTATTKIVAAGQSPVTVANGASLELLSTPATSAGVNFETGYPGQLLTLNGAGLNGQGALVSACTQTANCANGESWAGSIVLGSNTTIGTSDSLVFSSAGSFDGQDHNLTLVGAGAIAFNGAINNVYTFVSNVASGVILNNGGLTTIDGQTYNSLLVLAPAATTATVTTLKTLTGNITINQGVEGNLSGLSTLNNSLTLIGESANTVFTLGGPSTATAKGAFDVENMVVTGLVNGSDTLSVQTSDSQVWLVNQNNGGVITGFAGVNADKLGTGLTFTNIANTVGGTGNVRYIFDGAPTLSGSADGGANATMQKVVDYSTYGVELGSLVPVTVTLTSPGTGVATAPGSKTVNHFTGVNEIIAGGTGVLMLPNTQTDVTYTGTLAGLVGGSVGFDGFLSVVAPANVVDHVIFAAPTYLTLSSRLGLLDGELIQFSGFELNSFSGSFIPVLLPSEIQSTRTIYLNTVETMVDAAEETDNQALVRDGSYFSDDLPDMDGVTANIKHLVDVQKQLDEEYKKAMLKTIKTRQVLKAETTVNQASR